MRKREESYMCHTFFPQEGRFFFLFCKSLQIILSSKNILIELGWTKDGSLSTYNYMV